MQEVKGHLYRRDFEAAFGRDEYLQAYAVRWSSSRALGYARLLDGVFKDYFDRKTSRGDSTEPLRITCLGGGAGAELVALAGAIKLRLEPNPTADAADALADVSLDEPGNAPGRRIEASFVDIADWGSIINHLYQGTTTAPPMSAYASAALQASNRALIPISSFDASFQQQDVLSLSADELCAIVSGRHLVTIFFTLNELYTTSMSKARAFLLKLTQVVDPGTYLLVVDSAGSYSTVSLNGQEKKYPMHWLLDHALLKPVPIQKNMEGSGATRNKRSEGKPSWEKLREKESEWFRIPEGLKYPLDLENMRYQLHLYCKA